MRLSESHSGLTSRNTPEVESIPLNFEGRCVARFAVRRNREVPRRRNSSAPAVSSEVSAAPSTTSARGPIRARSHCASAPDSRVSASSRQSPDRWSTAAVSVSSRRQMETSGSNGWLAGRVGASILTTIANEPSGAWPSLGARRRVAAATRRLPALARDAVGEVASARSRITDQGIRGPMRKASDNEHEMASILDEQRRNANRCQQGGN